MSGNNAPFGSALMSAAGIGQGQALLDIGCGHGGRTIDTAQATGDRGRVLGRRLSGPMRGAAAAAAAGGAQLDIDHVGLRPADAQTDITSEELLGDGLAGA